MTTPDFPLWHFIQKDDIEPGETTVSENKVCSEKKYKVWRVNSARTDNYSE